MKETNKHDCKSFRLFVENYCGGIQAEAARKLKAYPAYVNNWYHGCILPNVTIAKKIEKLTKGKIKAYKIRPDLKY